MEKDIIKLRRNISALQKKLNRCKKVTTNQMIMNRDRKKQVALFNQFIKKLLDEGRITKEELLPYMPRRKK